MAHNSVGEEGAVEPSIQSTPTFPIVLNTRISSRVSVAQDVDFQSNSTAQVPPGAGPKDVDSHTSRTSWRPFSGIWNDITSRAPYYIRDWLDAWNYRSGALRSGCIKIRLFSPFFRVIPATAMIFFSKSVASEPFSLWDSIRTRRE